MKLGLHLAGDGFGVVSLFPSSRTGKLRTPEPWNSAPRDGWYYRYRDHDSVARMGVRSAVDRDEQFPGELHRCLRRDVMHQTEGSRCARPWSGF
jgi:hypothetical protein